ncbi:hypothetical protein ACJJTC_006203 [Scirpophaga incertulas]
MSRTLMRPTSLERVLCYRWRTRAQRFGGRFVSERDEVACYVFEMKEQGKVLRREGVHCKSCNGVMLLTGMFCRQNGGESVGQGEGALKAQCGRPSLPFLSRGTERRRLLDVVSKPKE